MSALPELDLSSARLGLGPISISTTLPTLATLDLDLDNIDSRRRIYFESISRP